MADKLGEDDELRKQISFLKNLISSAQNNQKTSNTQRSNAYDGNKSHRTLVKGACNSSYEFLPGTGNHNTRTGKREKYLNHADNTPHYNTSKTPSSTRSALGKNLSKYTWCKSKTTSQDSHPVQATCNQASSASSIDMSSTAQRTQECSTHTNSAIQHAGNSTVYDKSESEDYKFITKDNTILPTNYTKTRIKTEPASSAGDEFKQEAPSSIGPSNVSPSKSSLVQCEDKTVRKTSYRTAPYSISASPSKNKSQELKVRQNPNLNAASSLQKSIQQKLLNTEKAIQDLKRDIEKMKAVTSVEHQGQSKLQSLSPYKMQKVTCHPSPARESRDTNSKKPQEIPKNKTETLNSTNMLKSASSTMNAMATKVCNASIANQLYTKKQTPSKLVVKTRYAIKRERHISGNKSFSKNYVHILYNVSEDSKTRTNLSSSNNSSVQHAAKAVKSKYKYWPQRDVKSHNQWSGSSYYSQNVKYQQHKGPTAIHKSRKKQGLYRQSMHFFQGYQQGRKATSNYRGSRHRFASSTFPWKRRHLQHPRQNRKGYKQKDEWLRKNVPFDPRMKVDRRPVSPEKNERESLRAAIERLQRQIERAQKPGSHKPNFKYARAAGTKIVTHRRSSNRDVTYSFGKHGKKLTRLQSTNRWRQKGNSSHSWKAAERVSGHNKIQVDGVTYVESAPGVWEKSKTVQTRKFARRVINKSKAKLAAKYKKENKKLCMFYSRFGNCRKGESCPDLHDPDKVAVCTKFLRSACNDKNCRFSHKTTKEKMPVCTFFLKGNCNRDNCPYSHMNVSKDAEVCSNFVRGYCPQGEKCKKKHILVCEVFTKTGKCPLGRRCLLQHKAKRSARKLGQHDSTSLEATSVPTMVPSLSVVKQEPVCESEQEENRSESWQLSSKDRKLPAYISLNLKKETNQQTPSSTTDVINTGLKIRPQL